VIEFQYVSFESCKDSKTIRYYYVELDSESKITYLLELKEIKGVQAVYVDEVNNMVYIVHKMQSEVLRITLKAGLNQIRRYAFAPQRKFITTTEDRIYFCEQEKFIGVYNLEMSRVGKIEIPEGFSRVYIKRQYDDIFLMIKREVLPDIHWTMFVKKVPVDKFNEELKLDNFEEGSTALDLCSKASVEAEAIGMHTHYELEKGDFAELKFVEVKTFVEVEIDEKVDSVKLKSVSVHIAQLGSVSVCIAQYLSNVSEVNPVICDGGKMLIVQKVGGMRFLDFNFIVNVNRPDVAK